MAPKKKITYIETVKKSLSFFEGKKVIIACSGGADSMTLLDIVRAHGNIDIIVAHLNHNLRPTALRDEKIVQKYCKDNHLKFETRSVDIKKESKKTKTTLEECARNIRKEWFETLRKKHKAVSILTAHHGDDQAETLLYRITKWTSITGLVGIEEYSREYVRPLIALSKQEIHNYIQANSVPFGHDETNDDTTIPRNLIRHGVIPQLQNINPNLTTALIRLSNSARELKMSFDTFFAEVIEKKSFELDWYYRLPLGFQHELLRFLYEKTNGSTHGLSTALIEELDRFLSTRNGGKKEIKEMKLEKKQGTVFISQK